MAQITINEISQNYTYNIGSSAFATVALPITASWGPAYMDPATLGSDVSVSDVLETTKWEHFPATQEGLEAFVSTYRGPSTNYRITKDYSYQMAMTLLTSGYDVLVCRVCSGTFATGKLTLGENVFLHVKAKYPGKFGDNIKVTIRSVPHTYTTDGEGHKSVKSYYYNIIVYVIDPDTQLQNAVENLVFVFNENNATDSILQLNELESNFITFEVEGSVDDNIQVTNMAVTLTGGQDVKSYAEVSAACADAAKYAADRYGAESAYVTLINNAKEKGSLDLPRASAAATREWNFTAAFNVYDLLTDKLSYNPNRVIAPGWDEQDITFFGLTDKDASYVYVVSPLHKKLMDVACLSRCATAYLDIPKNLAPKKVHTTNANDEGYAQMLAHYQSDTVTNINSIYHTHSALFAPWGQYKYVGTSKQCSAPPAFLALLIQRAMILNQPTQYEWILPTNRKHNLPLGKLDYTVSNKTLDQWQNIEGVGVNVITTIPDLGTSLWGNSTLYEVPPATYQALANLSTRLLVNAVEDVTYRAGIAITFNYNNSQAYDRFYAAVTPLLDTMKNAGAIEDYYVRMAADINGLDQVNANTVIGKIYLIVNGVINDIIVDLVALPPSADLSQFKS